MKKYYLKFKLYDGAETVGRAYDSKELALKIFDAAVSLGVDVTLVANHHEE